MLTAFLGLLCLFLILLMFSLFPRPMKAIAAVAAVAVVLLLAVGWIAYTTINRNSVTNLKQPQSSPTVDPQIMRQLVGSVTKDNFRTFETFVSSNLDQVIGLKVAFGQSSSESLLQANKSGSMFVTYLRPNPSSEIVAVDGFQYQHGSYKFDGFFLVKSGGMHQGVISYALEPVPDAQVRLTKQVKQENLAP